MLKSTLSLSALAAFVIAPWLVLAPPAGAAGPSCPCFPDDDFTAVLAVAPALDTVIACDTHPRAGGGAGSPP